MELNKKLIIISETQDVVILKIGKFDQVIKLSPIEFDVVKYYSKVGHKKEVISHFKDTITIDNDDLNLLINKAKDLNILVANNSQYSTEYWLKFKLKRNKKLFEVFTVDFSGSRFEKLFENTFFLNFLISIAILFSIYMLYNILSSPLNFKQNYLETLYAVPIRFQNLIGYIYLSTFLSVCFHEIGHYFFYKYYNGKSSIFGFGLLFFFLPVFYNKIFILTLKKKRDKIIVNLGGIFFDFFFLLFLIFFTKNYHAVHPTFSFLCYVTIISICIRTFFNINIFLPNTDGYFVFTDLINKPHLFDFSKQTLWQFIKNKKTISKNLPYLVYAILGYLSILISWSFFFLPLFFYFYYAIKN